MKNKKQEIGKFGEDSACSYLQLHGHEIVARNWRHSHLEIDIISLENSRLHFIEVKSRSAPAIAPPQTNVNNAKCARLARAATAFLSSAKRKNLPPDLEVLFDVLTVLVYPDKIEMEYYPQAFIPTYV